MWLERIKLKNWKCFLDATFDFPRPSEKKSVVLVGALNGAGKTSLLEAVLCCLYGPKAMPSLPIRNEDKKEDGYKNFIARRINKTALEQGNLKAEIECVFNDDDVRLTIKRIVQVHVQGGFKSDEVLLFEGTSKQDIEDRRPYKFSALDENTRDEQIYSVVAQRILPHELAGFFFFDGERIQDIASKNRSEAVRNGIEELLGVKLLRILQDDLKTVQGRIREQKSTASATQSQHKELADAIHSLEQSKDELTEKRDALITEIELLRSEQERIQENANGSMSGQSSDINELSQRRKWSEMQRDEAYKKLGEEILGKDLALAMVGSLRGDLRKRIELDKKLLRWRSGRESFADQCKRLVDIFQNISDPSFDPPLTDAQSRVVADRLSKAQELVHYPPPSDLPETIRHDYLSDQDRAQVFIRLDAIDSLSQRKIIGLVKQYENANAEIQVIIRRQAELAEGSRAMELLEELKKITEKLANSTRTRDDTERTLSSVTHELSQKKAELGRFGGHSNQLNINIQKEELCSSIIAMVEDYVADLRKRKCKELGEVMTQCYQKMARKGDVVSRIEVSKLGEVTLLGRNGRVISAEQDLSAGENEIFALSLLQAAARITNIKRPMIIDTPLARFDSHHRANVVSSFMPKASNQVIVLSTDTEVVGELEKIIRPHVAKEFLLEFDQKKELTQVTSDEYFK